jgi:hypothetical protein
MTDGPADLLAAGPAPRIIGRQGGRRVVLLPPVLIGGAIFVALVVELGPDDKPVPDQDRSQLRLKPRLTALEAEPVSLRAEGWTTSGGYHSLYCLASFETQGHTRAPLRLDVEMPLLEQPVSCIFSLDYPLREG